MIIAYKNLHGLDGGWRWRGCCNGCPSFQHAHFLLIICSISSINVGIYTTAIVDEITSINVNTSHSGFLRKSVRVHDKIFYHVIYFSAQRWMAFQAKQVCNLCVLY